MKNLIDYYTATTKSEFLWFVRFSSLLVVGLYASLLEPLLWFGYLLIMIAVFVPSVVNKYFFWIAVFVLQTLDLWVHWYSKANHCWVMWYWTVVILMSFVFSLDSVKQLRMLQSNARWLLIIIMLVAVFYKAISPEYISGDFFEFNIASNTLMAPFVSVVSDLKYYQILENATRVSKSMQGINGEVFVISSTPFAHVFSIFVTWWVLLIELVIGILLLFYKKSADYWAHVFHLWFIVGAYAAAPILGFAWILMVLGFVLSWDQSGVVRKSYFWVTFILLLYALPREDIMQYVLALFV